MEIQVFDIVFNLIINIFQAYIICCYLINILECKTQFNRIFVYLIGIVSISFLLELQTLLVVFDGIGVFATFILAALICTIFLQGKLLKKLIHTGLIIVLFVFMSILIGSISGILIDSSYLELVLNISLTKYVCMVVVQLVVYVIVKLVIRYANHGELGNNLIYSTLAIVLSIVSIVSVVFLQRLVIENDKQKVVIYSCTVFVGIMFLVIVSLTVYGISEKLYAEKMRKELEIAVYKRQKYDLNQMNETVHQVEKVKHELNKICFMTDKLLKDKKYEQAEEFLNKFYDNEVSEIDTFSYTDNIILNYILNTKIKKCKVLDIQVKCVVNGSIDGIDDVDLHCIMTNLWDNAIEAVQELSQKEISCYIFGSDDSLDIEMNNTVKSSMTYFDSDMGTTKKEPEGHGYGLINIKNTVKKYNGICEYKKGKKNYLTCKIFLFKSFTTKNGRSRQID